ncbi:MAG: HTH domain-containing protein [Clostridia bacterium]|nr:HTH domain-containing protein [Clostridia bacterium]
MTARQKRIWDLLAEHDCLTSQQIAALLHISDRTVRSDIKEINGEQKSEVIRSKKGQGYFIDAGQLDKRVRASETGRPEDDLEWAIIRQVLFCRETPYLDLAEELFISDTLLSKIVAELNRNITRRHNLPAILKQNGILTLAASEEEKRSYYTLYIMNRNVNHYFDME